jgi:hypothetical protein
MQLSGGQNGNSRGHGGSTSRGGHGGNLQRLGGIVEICKDGEFWLLDLTIRKVALKEITSYFDKGPSKI